MTSGRFQNLFCVMVVFVIGWLLLGDDVFNRAAHVFARIKLNGDCVPVLVFNQHGDGGGRMTSARADDLNALSLGEFLCGGVFHCS